MNSIEKLTEIETKLRKRDTDLSYLTSQLQLLAAVLAHDNQNESGLVRGALGGMMYCLERLRKLWGAEGESEPVPSFEQLQEIYAQVELSRYAHTPEVVEETKARLLQDCMMARVIPLTLSDGTVVNVFASDRDQFTVEGDAIAEGELLEASSAMVPSFHVYYNTLQSKSK